MRSSLKGWGWEGGAIACLLELELDGGRSYCMSSGAGTGCRAFPWCHGALAVASGESIEAEIGAFMCDRGACDNGYPNNLRVVLKKLRVSEGG